MSNLTVPATAEGMPDAERVATEHLAAMDFEPWSGSPGEEPPPENTAFVNEALGFMPAVRLAHVLMFKSKAELIEACGQNEDDWLDMVEGITSAKLFFQIYANSLEAAEIRALIAASASSLKNEEASR